MSLVVERPAAGVVVVRVAGDVDMVSVPQLEDCVGHLLSLTGSDLVLDLDQVTFCGCTGLAALLRLGELAEVSETALHVVCVANRYVARPLALTGSPTRFATYSSLAEALAAAAQGEPMVERAERSLEGSVTGTLTS